MWNVSHSAWHLINGQKMIPGIVISIIISLYSIEYSKDNLRE